MLSRVLRGSLSPPALWVRGWREIYTQMKSILVSLGAFCELLASIPLLNKPALAQTSIFQNLCCRERAEEGGGEGVPGRDRSEKSMRFGPRSHGLEA